MHDSDRLRANVRAELGRARVTAAEMDRRLGWSRATLSRRLLGSVTFRAHELDAIAGELDIPVARLFEGVSSPGPGTPQNDLVSGSRTG